MAIAIRKAAKIKTVVGFIGAIKKLTGAGSDLRTYRGQRDASWSNYPGILRPVYSKMLKNERDVVRKIQSVHPQEFQHDDTMFDRLVRMRHYGLPTRLMDVTANVITHPRDGRV